MVEEKDKKELKKEQVAKIVEVATQTAPAIEMPDGQIYSEQQVLVWLVNGLAELKKGLL